MHGWVEDTFNHRQFTKYETHLHNWAVITCWLKELIIIQPRCSIDNRSSVSDLKGHIICKQVVLCHSVPDETMQWYQCNVRFSSKNKIKWFQQTLGGYSGDVDTFFHIFDHWLRLRNGPKMVNFGPKPTIQVIRGHRASRWLVKVDQMLDHSGTHVWGLLQM